MAEKKQTAQYPANAKIVRFAVPHFVFDQRAYLPVYQPVKLRHQNEMITVFPMLGEKTVPLVPVFCVPGAAVKNQLTLINHYPGLPFYDMAVWLSFVADQSKIHQPVRRKFMIFPIKKISFGLALPRGNAVIVNIKISDNIPPVIQIKINFLRNMIAFTTTGSTRI